MKKLIGWLLRLLGICAAIALLCWTVSSTGANPYEALKGADPWLLLAAFACVGSTHLIGGYLWGRLLAVQGVEMSFLLLYQLTLAGTFFSQVIPGSVSGDVVKLAIVARRHPGKGTAAVMSCLIDRVAGVSGLFLVASLCGGLFWLMRPEIVAAETVLQTALLLVFLGGAAFLCMLAVMVYHGLLLKIGWLKRFVEVLGRFCPKIISDLVVRLCTAADAYSRHKRVLVEVLALSMLIHFMLGVGVFCTGRALGEARRSFGAYIISMQVGNAVTLVPATPGGLGMRESMTAAMFTAFGREAKGQEDTRQDEGKDSLAGSIPVVNTLCTIAWALIGAVALGTLPKRQASS